MFCCFRSAGGSARSVPTWDPAPLAFGSDKEVFMGTFKGTPVAVCVAKKQGEKRLRKEIQVLNQLGKHPHIVSMLYSNTSTKGSYLALEAVQPVGFDLDRLVKQYVFARQSVPSQLTRTLISQLGDALSHMHKRQIIHRDVKSENVLVTTNYDAKLIDMGIACKLDMTEERWIWSSKQYFAPEMCRGLCEQGPGVDTWGLGLIMHQTYQHRWDLIDASKEQVVMRPNRPSKAEPMEENLMQAMLGLLAFDSNKRWSIAKCHESIGPETGAGGPRDSWYVPAVEKNESRKHLCKFKGSASPLTAYAAIVDDKSKHLHGKRVDEVRFREDHNAILLLVAAPKGEDKKELFAEKVPKRDTIIKEGCWLYFGIPPEHHTEEAVLGLKNAIFPAMDAQSVGRSVNAKAGLMAFSLEFDCFQFPAHIGKGAVIGSTQDGDATSLNLRGNFNLNLAGILRPSTEEPEWFPGPTAMVETGDLGLVVRSPCKDGTTEHTVTDDQLEPLMDQAQFVRIISPQTERRASE